MRSIAFVLLATTAVASAQPAPPAPAEDPTTRAKQLYTEGKRFYDIGEFAKANGLRYIDIPYLVKDALSRGLLITNEMNDSRSGLLWPGAPQAWAPSDEITLQRRF